MNQSVGFFQCKICSKELESPLLLSCNHSFCSDCCNQLLSNKSPQCPFCKTKISDATKFEDLEPDLTTQLMQEIKKKRKTISPFKLFMFRM